jgi:hypothetical protein
MRRPIFVSSFILAVFLLVARVDADPLTFADGGYHIIDYNVGYENVDVDYGAPGVSTHVELATGGAVLYDISAWEDARVTVSGGYLGRTLCGYDRSHLMMSAGAIIQGANIFDDSHITVYGGTIDYTLRAHINGQIDFYGGSAEIIGGGDYSRVTISGGSVDTYVYAHNDSRMTISGGTFGEYLWAQNQGLITLMGTNFAVNGVPVEYGSYASSFGSSGIITGTLANGDYLDNAYNLYHTGDITFAIPEPATFVLLGLGVLSSRRRHN